jgi:hypothetical protein
VRLRVPAGAPHTPPPPPPDRICAEAELDIGEIQSLADNIGEIARAAAGLDLRYRVRLEIGRAGIRLTDEQLFALNEALEKAGGKLKFEIQEQAL